MRTTRGAAFRRTRRTAAAVVGATLLTATLTDSGGAAPAQAEPFNKGEGNAIALGYKVNPTQGGLSFGITAGESVAGHQNTGATGQSKAINLGVIGVTLAGEGCDGGAPTLPEEQQPQPVVVQSTDEGAAQGKSASEAGVIEKFARATPQPYAEAITTIAPLGDPATLYISGGRTIAHSGIVADGVREAMARTEIGSIKIAGVIELRGLTWQAIHRSGAVNETLGSFSLGELVIAGQSIPLPDDMLQQLKTVGDLLAPLGVAITAPEVRVEEGIVFVDPLKIGVVPNPQRDSLTAPLLSALQPVREAVTDALLELSCKTSTFITLADVIVGSVTGAGRLSLDLGGVQATTAEIDAFAFPQAPSLPPLSNAPSTPAVLGDVASPSLDLSTPAAPSTAPSTPTTTAADGEGDDEEVRTQSIADTTGDRGGLMALVGGGGLLLLLATAEADRRKMQRAMREIPLED